MWRYYKNKHLNKIAIEFLNYCVNLINFMLHQCGLKTVIPSIFWKKSRRAIPNGLGAWPKIA